MSTRRTSGRDAARGPGRRRYRQRAGLVSGVAICLGLAVLAPPLGATASASERGDGFRQVNLVSDLPGLAKVLDPAVKNPWGIAMGPATPLWVDNNFNPAFDFNKPVAADLLTKITLYRGENGKDPFSKVGLEVTASAPTGIVFNPTSQFVINQRGTMTPARFIFNENFINAAGTDSKGVVSGWSNVPPPPPTTTTLTAATSDPGFHSGLALVPGDAKRGSRLLVADNRNGVVLVFDAAFNKVTTPGLFVDPKAKADGLAPYNVTALKDRVYVSYASATEQQGGGAVSVFSSGGKFKKRLVTGGKLNDPWGMAIAPHDWGEFGGALLVGNVDDGMINAFNRRNGHFLGTVKDAMGKPLVNPGLWGLAFGNGTIGTPNTLLFAAGIGSAAGGLGPDVYEHGLVGLIEPAGEQDDD